MDSGSQNYELSLVTEFAIANALFAKIQPKNRLLPRKRELEYDVLLKIG